MPNNKKLQNSQSWRKLFISGLFNTKNVNTIEELIIKKVNNFFKNIYPVDKLEFYFSQG